MKGRCLLCLGSFQVSTVPHVPAEAAQWPPHAHYWTITGLGARVSNSQPESASCSSLGKRASGKHTVWQPIGTMSPGEGWDASRIKHHQHTAIYGPTQFPLHHRSPTPFPSTLPCLPTLISFYLCSRLNLVPPELMST